MSRAEWKKVRLGDIAKIGAGQSAPKYDTDFGNQGLPFIRAGHLEQLVSSFPEKLLPKVSDSIAFKYKLKKYPSESVIFAKSGMSATLNRIYKLKTESYVVSHLAIIEPNRILCDSDFLTYLLSWKNPSVLIKDSAYPSISLSDICNWNVLVPPIENQHHIAATLDKANELIALRKKQLKELDALAEAVFYDMFGDPVKNEKGWETIYLKKVTNKIGSGATPRGGNENYKSKGISLIRSLNVYNGKFQYKDLAHIDEEQAKLLDNVTVYKNDVLLNITGASVARCCIVPKELLPARVNQHVAIIRTKKDLNNIYLTSVLTSQSYQQKLLRLSKSNGATREALTKADIENLQIHLPPLPLQTRFAAIIEKIEEQKARVRKALQESENLFQRLMQDLFKPD